LNAEAASVAQSRVQAWFAKRTPWQRRGLATAAGALATLGHAPFQLTLLYVVAITVLVWLLDVTAAK
jgi:apolipoprotein N-acyltransferase